MAKLFLLLVLFSVQRSSGSCLDLQYQVLANECLLISDTSVGEDSITANLEKIRKRMEDYDRNEVPRKRVALEKVIRMRESLRKSRKPQMPKDLRVTAGCKPHPMLSVVVE